MARLVRHALNRGNVLEGPLRDRIANGGNPGCQRAGSHPPTPFPDRAGKFSLGAWAGITAGTAEGSLWGRERPIGSHRIQRPTLPALLQIST